MLSITDTINQYENTHAQLLAKIQAISDKMHTVRKQVSGRYQNDSTFVKLSHRRDSLKDMIDDVEYAISQLKSYQAAITTRIERIDKND